MSCFFAFSLLLSAEIILLIYEYNKSRICFLFKGDSGLKSYIERIRVTFVSRLKAYLKIGCYFHRHTLDRAIFDFFDQFRRIKFLIDK